MQLPPLFAVAFVVVVVAAATDDDFAFDVDDQPTNVFLDWKSPISATIGKVFHLVVPKSGTTKFDAKTALGEKPLPRWLLFDKTDAVFWGVPLPQDAGTLRLHVKAIGTPGVVRNLTIEVNSPTVTSSKCQPEDATYLSLLIGKEAEAIKPKQRVIGIMDLSKFLGLPHSAFTLKTISETTEDSSVISMGPGDGSLRSATSIASIEAPVGCDGRLFPQAAILVHQLRQQAKDGTISEVLGMPLIKWRVITKRGSDRRKRQALDASEGSGEYEGEYYDDYEVDGEDYEEEASPPKAKTTTTTAATENSSAHPHRHHHGEAKKDEISPVWPIVEDNSIAVSPTSTEVPKQSSKTSSTSTTTTTTSPPTTTQASTSIKMNFPDIVKTLDEEDYEGEDDDEDFEDTESETIVPIPKSIGTTKIVASSTTMAAVEPSVVSSTTTTTTENPIVIMTEPQTSTLLITETETTTPTTTTSTTTTTTTTTELPTTTITTTTSTASPTTTISTTPSTTTTTISTTTNPPTTVIITTLPPTTTELAWEQDTPSEELTTSAKSTTLRHVPNSTPPPTTIAEDDSDPKNFPPYLGNQLERKYVIGGKIFRFVIPEDTFRDSEDNYDLRFEFLNLDETPVSETAWCQFNPARREIYGLPLDDHVSKWEYLIRATDKDGASIQDKLTILVQQHKLQRVFNHEFSLEIRIDKRDEFRHYFDWSLRTLRALGKVYNTNMSEITVRAANHTGHTAIFTWSNDSLATGYCPKQDIEKLFKRLTANDRGDPSRELNAAIGPELRVKKVSFRGNGVCEELNTPIAPPINFPPILRNPVNRINATVGEMLFFKVPKDTFYDPEDLDTLSLNLTLLTGKRREIPPDNWLQFDSKNREFFGIPWKTSRSEYQLICVDSGGLPVIDSLEVIVHPPKRTVYNVEFSMTIEMNHQIFVSSPNLQRKFVDKLVEIFRDKNASQIHFLPFKLSREGYVVATWFNKSLSLEKCPHDDIAQLEAIIKKEDHGISHHVLSIMEPEFKVSTIYLNEMGNCKIHKPKYHLPKPHDEKIAIDESAHVVSSSDEYLWTFIIPLVVIVVMTFFAILAACILYRRRRTGKMNVVEDGRQGYGNKGIPVIFQEELDEKPEVGTKTPVILKDEKPPLAPPEYSKSGSLKFTDDSEPYHPPPPPFTRSQDKGNKSRPKPAPTYRKPPPYVPP